MRLAASSLNCLNADPVFQVRNLVKRYPSGTLAVDNVSFDLLADDFLIIIGCSGAGKSTLLQLPQQASGAHIRAADPSWRGHHHRVRQGLAAGEAPGWHDFPTVSLGQ